MIGTCIHGRSLNHTSLKIGLEVTQVTPYIEHVPTNTRPHQLRWGDWEMYSHDSALLYKKGSQMAGLFGTVRFEPSKLLYVTVLFDE